MTRVIVHGECAHKFLSMPACGCKFCTRGLPARNKIWQNLGRPQVGWSGHFPTPGNWVKEPKISRKPEVSRQARNQLGSCPMHSLGTATSFINLLPPKRHQLVAALSASSFRSVA